MKTFLRRGDADQYDAPAADGPALVCRGVDVAYDKVQVLFGVDMDVERNEIVALLGTNGAGKSTLLKAISGLVDPAAGRIWFDGQDITKADAVTTSKMGIIQVPGGKAVFPTLTVAEYFMEKGEVRFSGPTQELLERGDILRSVFLQGASSMKGDAAPSKLPAKASASGNGQQPVVLEVNGMTKRFGGISAVNDVTFSLH